MSQIYMRNKSPRRDSQIPPKTAAGTSAAELASGPVPAPGDLGSRVDLPAEIREKMETSFGADFSNVKLYQSQAVADAGARAVTRGANIAFAPGELDLTSTAGQALLGHELSHVVSQARGESAGRGFLNDPSLEAQADRQGAMAARGESVYAGPVTPVGETSAASSAGPIQAKKNEEKADIQMERMGLQGKAADLGWRERSKLAKAYDAEEARRRKLKMPSSGREDAIETDIPEGANIMPPPPGSGAYMTRLLRMTNAGNRLTAPGATRAAPAAAETPAQPQAAAETPAPAAGEEEKPMGEDAFHRWYMQTFNQNDYDPRHEFITGGGRNIDGFNLDRAHTKIYNMGLEENMKDDELKGLMMDLMSKRRLNAPDPNSSNREEALRGREDSSKTDAALKKVKDLYHGKLKKLRDQYGVTLTQLHPEDAFKQAGNLWVDAHLTQDVTQLLESAPEIFDQNNAEDREFNNLANYYAMAQKTLETYASYKDNRDFDLENRRRGREDFSSIAFGQVLSEAKQYEAAALADDTTGSIPSMGDKERRAYRRKAIKKYGKLDINGLDYFADEDDSGEMAPIIQMASEHSGKPIKANTIDDFKRIRLEKDEEVRRRREERRRREAANAGSQV